MSESSRQFSKNYPMFLASTGPSSWRDLPIRTSRPCLCTLLEDSALSISGTRNSFNRDRFDFRGPFI